MVDVNGCLFGIELILLDWFYVGVIDDVFVLMIDCVYFELMGGFERWFYCFVCKYGGC